MAPRVPQLPKRLYTTQQLTEGFQLSSMLPSL